MSITTKQRQDFLKVLKHAAGLAGLPDRAFSDQFLDDIVATVTDSTQPVEDSVRTLWVDPVNGDDNASGLTKTTPLKTIQTAINKFLPAKADTPYWTRRDDRFIRVVFTPGMAAIPENVVIPYHRGPGALRIVAEEQILVTGLVTSGMSALSGFEQRQRVAFTTSPLTPGAFDHQAFAVLHDRDTIEPEIFEALWEDLPIVATAAGTIDVVSSDPGLFSTFHWQNGASVDIVKPQIAWTPPAVTGTNPEGLLPPEPPCILNNGGPLVVQGFLFLAPDDSNPSSLARVILVNQDAYLGNGFGQSVALNRCVIGTHVSQSWATGLSGPGMIEGCIVTGGNGGIHNLSACSPGFTLTNVDVQIDSGDACSVSQCYGSLSAFGLNVWGGGTFSFSQVGNGFALVDIRGSASDANLFISNGSYVYLGAISAEQMGFAAILVGTLNGGNGLPCSVFFGDSSRTKGSTGNSGKGLIIGALSSAGSLDGAMTLTGAGGNVTLGATALTWAAAAAGAVDATRLARFN